MEILGKVLGSPARVKIMRLFMLNRSKVFSGKEVTNRSRVSSAAARAELKILSAAGFIKKRSEGHAFNPSFKYASEFEAILTHTEAFNKEGISEVFKKAGRVKLLVISGVFIKNKESRVDLLIVGDRLKKSKIEEGIKKLEADTGAELTYADFETKDFIYRLNMYDKLVRDILDFPHEVVLQHKELSTHLLKKS